MTARVTLEVTTAACKNKNIQKLKTAEAISLDQTLNGLLRTDNRLKVMDFDAKQVGSRVECMVVGVLSPN